MTRPGRIACVNPACRRTAADAGDGAAIICGKCWKLLPPAVRNRYLQLKRRERRLLKLIDKRARHGAIDRASIGAIEHRITLQMAENWQLMRDCFHRPDKPVGLDGFLKEMGL